jgi:hypothetical protein
LKPNYQFEKRRRDLAKKQKQEEKRLRKLAEKEAAGGVAPADSDPQPGPADEAPPK